MEIPEKMVEYNKVQLEKKAQQHGFVRDTFEKVLLCLVKRENSGIILLLIDSKNFPKDYCV